MVKRLFGVFIILAVATSSFSLLAVRSVQAEDKKTVKEEIPEILKERETIAPQEYDELTLQPFLLLQGQFRAFEANNPGNNEFSIRAARLGLKGTIYKYYDFNVVGEFGKGRSDLLYGYMGFNRLPWARLRVGQFKQPFSLDWYTSAGSRDFIELPLPIGNLIPGRDIGVMLHGNIRKGFVNYSLSLSNGTGINTSDTNDDKDIVARVVFTPFNGSMNVLLKGLHLGAAMTHGNQEAEREEMRLEGKFFTAGETVFFQINEDVFHDGDRSRYGAEVAWIIGPFAVKGEWVRMDLDDLFLVRGGSKDDFRFDGSYVSLSYVLTGESQPFKDGKYGMITPKQSFDPQKGTWGAIQVLARYESLSLDSDLFTKGYADPNNYTDGADGFTLGVNWYLNDKIRAMINYNRTEFDDHIVKDGEELKNEDVVLVRIQLTV